MGVHERAAGVMRDRTEWPTPSLSCPGNPKRVPCGHKSPLGVKGSISVLLVPLYMCTFFNSDRWQV